MKPKACWSCAGAKHRDLVPCLLRRSGSDDAGGRQPWRRHPFHPLKRLARSRQAPSLEPRRRSSSDLPSVAAAVLRIRGRCADFQTPKRTSTKQEKENDIHSIRTEVVAPGAAKSGPGHAGSAGLRIRTIHERPEVHHRGPWAGGPVVVAGPAIHGQRQWTGQRGERFSPTPATPANGYRTPSCGKEPARKTLASPGLGGPNSVAYGVNIWGQAVGQADTQTPDPNGEDFCGSTALGLTHSGNTCVPFLWQNGTMVALPRLRNSAGTEGSNGVALEINDFGMVAGTAENGEVDSTCPGRVRFAADHRVQAGHLDETLPLVAGAHPGASHR